MNITPIQPINTLADLNQAAPAAKAGGSLPFQALFEDAASKVEQT
ncbi:MAG TPA: flagellar hook-basal body complex protein FliE, partial [Ruminococcaceae bacterium]|nr:flagellar hook-basal body complex protein FliE [Oscillospiraceae bacterium]